MFMHLNRSLFALTLTAAIVLSTCIAAAANAGNRFTVGDASFELPAGWTREDQGERVLFTAPDLKPNEQAFFVFIKAPPTRDDFQAALKTLFERFGYKLVEAKEPRYSKSEDGREAVSRSATVESADGKRLSAVQGAFRVDDRLAVFMFAATPDQFERHRWAVVLVTSSLRVGETATAANPAQREAPAPEKKRDKPALPAGESKQAEPPPTPAGQMPPVAADKPAAAPRNERDTNKSPPPAQAPLPPSASNATEVAGVPMGRYDCTSNIIRQRRVQESSPSVPFDLFADGSYATGSGQQKIEPPSGLFEWPKDGGQYRIAQGRLRWLSGPRADSALQGEIPFGNGVIFGGQISRSPQGRTVIVASTDAGGIARFCEHAGPSPRASPLLAFAASENPETYLQPKERSASPATGKGKLRGLYVRKGLSGPLVMYFAPDAKAFTGAYRWGYDSIDCSRIGKRDKPFWNQPLCKNYRIHGEEFQIEGEEPRPFKQDGASIQIGPAIYTPVLPEKNLRLNGVFAHYWSVTTGAGFGAGRQAFTFTPDGKFAYSDDAGSATNWGGETTYGTGRVGANTGTYQIDGYHIDFKTAAGITLRYSFFRTEAGIKINNTDFLPKQK
jgi:hypothetical protein